MATTRGTVALGISLAVLLSGCTAAWEQVRVDHRTGTAPAEPSGDGGPPPGILTELWRVDDIPTTTATTKPENAFWLESGNLLVFDDTGVRSYAVATGEPGWSYHEPGRTVRGYATDGVVVISSSDSSSADGENEDTVGRLVGLSAGDGKLLWQRENEWRTGELPPADGIVAALPADRHTSGPLSGLDVHTGEIRWETDYRGCGIPDLDQIRSHDGSVVLVGGSCAAGVRWDAFDPADGRQLWTQRWNSSTPGVHAGGMSVVDGTTLSNRGQEVIRIDRDGTAHDAVPVEAGRQHGFYQEIDAAPTLSLRDLRTGEEAVSGWPALLGTAAFAGDTVYYLNQAGVADWLPQLVVGNLADGTHQSMPLPGAVPFPAHQVWLGVTGEHLLTASRSGDGKVSVTALGSTPTDGPVELGGVPQKSWPDPCALLAAAPLPSEPGTVDEHEQVLTDAGGTVTLPRVHCVRHLPGGDRLTLRVPWVAATEKQAAGRLGGTPGPTGVDELTTSPTGLAGARIARVGTVFVEVWADDQDVVTTTLEAVAAHLRA